MDLGIFYERQPRFGENRADIKKGARRQKEATMALVPPERSMMVKLVHGGDRMDCREARGQGA